MNYTSLKTPGVYVNEISIFPPSVAQVPTAVPGFIGYTQQAQLPSGESLLNKAYKVSSLIEFQLYYGGGPPLKFSNPGHLVEIDTNGQFVRAHNEQDYYLYDSLQMFYANGGGDCYIVSVGNYSNKVASPDLKNGIDNLGEMDEPTMILFPDGVTLGSGLYDLQVMALKQCGDLMDRVGVFDTLRADDKNTFNNNLQGFRDNIGMSNLKYGAAYAPWIKVGLDKQVHYRDMRGCIVSVGSTTPIDLTTLVNGYSTADKAQIVSTINNLDSIVADSNTISGDIAFMLNHSNFTSYAPSGVNDDQPSFEQLFNITVKSALAKIAAAEIETDATQKQTKTVASANEVMKLCQQVFNLMTIIDDAGASTLNNQAFRANTISVVGITGSTFPATPGGDFSGKVTSFASLDATYADSTLKFLGDGTITSAVSASGFKTYKVSGTAGITNATDDATRLINQTQAVKDMSALFSYFNNVVSGILSFADATEKSSEDALLKTWPIYKNIVDGVNNTLSVLPPSGAVAGIYASVDNDRGVWKAPANVSVSLAKGTLVNITDAIQDGMNVDVNAGKSINAIRSFSGKGVLVWGARTLAGNDNEWRYISVRRFFNMVEESVKKSTSWVVFEPNDANTWIKVKSMIENFLTLLWREGALAGAKPEEAFGVYVGLNQTMTAIDILEGRMIIRIEMAAVRPAEFIILEFAHKLQTS